MQANAKNKSEMDELFNYIIRAVQKSDSFLQLPFLCSASIVRENQEIKVKTMERRIASPVHPANEYAFNLKVQMYYILRMPVTAGFKHQLVMTNTKINQDTGLIEEYVSHNGTLELGVPRLKSIYDFLAKISNNYKYTLLNVQLVEQFVQYRKKIGAGPVEKSYLIQRFNQARAEMGNKTIDRPITVQIKIMMLLGIRVNSDILLERIKKVGVVKTDTYRRIVSIEPFEGAEKVISLLKRYDVSNTNYDLVSKKPKSEFAPQPIAQTPYITVAERMRQEEAEFRFQNPNINSHSVDSKDLTNHQAPFTSQELCEPKGEPAEDVKPDITIQRFESFLPPSFPVNQIDAEIPKRSNAPLPANTIPPNSTNSKILQRALLRALRNMHTLFYKELQRQIRESLLNSSKNQNITIEELVNGLEMAVNIVSSASSKTEHKDGAVPCSKIMRVLATFIHPFNNPRLDEIREKLEIKSKELEKSSDKIGIRFTHAAFRVLFLACMEPQH